VEVRAGLQAGSGFEDRAQIFIGGSGIGRRFENNKNPIVQMRCDGTAGFQDVGDVGLAILVQRRGDADDDGIDFLDAGEIGRGLQATGGDFFADGVVGDVFDVGFSPVTSGDLLVVDVEAENGGAGTGELEAQGEADVTEADDGNVHKAKAES
jgi:hypothetical protein